MDVTDFELVNPVPVDEVEGWMAALATTLLGDPYADNFENMVDAWRGEWLPDLAWGARSKGRWVATLATEPRTLTIPGHDGRTIDIVADALAGVSVAATHRRRGILTSMLTQSLAAARARGDAVSILVAAEWPIYGRFGYSPASQASEYTYFPRRRHASVTPAAQGTVRQVENEEAGKHAPAIFDAARRLRVGQVDRPGGWWSRRLGINGMHMTASGKAPHWFLHEGPDGPDGLLSWRVTRDFELDGAMGALEVGDLLAATEDAYRNIWAYLSGIDVIEEIALHKRPVDEPVRWLLPDGRALHQGHTGDWLWVRLLDVPAALASRGYAVPGRLVLDVLDSDVGGYGQGRVLLDADRSGTQCTPTAESADLRLSQRALASAFLGGHSLRELAAGGGVDELTRGALDRADAMFVTALAPWNATAF